MSAHWPTDNKFLNGPFAPWAEESEAYDLEVLGQIPSDLAGALFRTAAARGAAIRHPLSRGGRS